MPMIKHFLGSGDVSLRDLPCEDSPWVAIWVTGRDEAAERALHGFGEEGDIFLECVSHLAWHCVVGRNEEWIGKAIPGCQWSEYLPT